MKEKDEEADRAMQKRRINFNFKLYDL